MELLDVIDENNKLTGKVEERKIIHENGLWHRHVGADIMNENGEMLYQKRAETKKLNPNKWARTGGHIDAGEKPITAMQREIKEELGIEVSSERIELISIKKQEQFYPEQNQYQRFYTYNYFIRVNYQLEDYQIQKEELSEVKYFSIEEMEEMKKRNDLNYTFVKWNDFEEKVKFLKKRRESL